MSFVFAFFGVFAMRTGPHALNQLLGEVDEPGPIARSNGLLPWIPEGFTPSARELGEPSEVESEL
jgi:hypothetical protein